jgi:two-component system alkaline phosphatase synthesis response regulator PhoP
MRKRILIVDDDPDILDALAIWLEDRFEVVTAGDGGEALRLVFDQSFDLILLDLMMPAVDGATVKRTLDSQGVQVPVVVVSAISDLPRHARALGVTDYLAKPLDLEVLDATIARVTGGPRGGGTSGPGTGSGGGGGGGGGGSGFTSGFRRSSFASAPP